MYNVFISIKSQPLLNIRFPIAGTNSKYPSTEIKQIQLISCVNALFFISDF